MMMTDRRTYSGLVRLSNYVDRFEYLKLLGSVGDDTFGHERWLNQAFYRSREWRRVRSKVIARDLGCDLGCEDRPIHDRILVHHMNPIRPEDLGDLNPEVLDPEFLICVSHETHNAIHYGDQSGLILVPEERRPGDTKLW